MSKQIITEATLVAPTFTGSDEEISLATQTWSSLISCLNYVNQPSYNGTSISAENKKGMICALHAYLCSKMDEVNNVTPPPVVATAMPTPVPAPVVAPQPEIEMTYAENKQLKESAMTKRMRELAGIPHVNNRV